MNVLGEEKFKLIAIQHEYQDLIASYQEKIKRVASDYKNNPFLQATLLEQYTTKLQLLERTINTPFFGRIDFLHDEDTKDTVCYIGKVGVLDDDGNPITVDWRAPISSLYYDSNIGYAKYLAPEGIMKGELKLKRQFNIQDGKLISYQDVNTVSDDELLKPYLSTSADNRHNFSIPLSYFMWGVVLQDSCNVRCIRLQKYDTMTSINGDTVLYRKTLEKLKEIIEGIDAQELPLLDKCILVSNYLQSKVQYVVDGGKSYADKVYVVDAREEDVMPSKVGSVSSVIHENYGLCMAIANATTLLLNNPILNVNVRSVYGSSHAWNVVVLDGHKYYMDNTWAITRNSNRVSWALKATSFSDDYLLFGEKFAKEIGHHDSQTYLCGDLESNGFSRDEIQKRVRVLKSKYEFDYPSTTRFRSYIENV